MRGAPRQDRKHGGMQDGVLSEEGEVALRLVLQQAARAEGPAARAASSREEGPRGQQAQRDTPWFDPREPIKIRQVFLNGQKTVSGRLPIETIIPAENWVLKLRYEKADLQGYVTAYVLNCPLR